ncbi:MAG: hypothetical protein WA208_00885 [Thermoanaerobaculia bacterium]
MQEEIARLERERRPVYQCFGDWRREYAEHHPEATPEQMTRDAWIAARARGEA